MRQKCNQVCYIKIILVRKYIYGLRSRTLIFQHIIFIEQLTWFLWELPYKTLLDPDIGSWWSHRSAAWMSSIIPFSVPWSIRIQRGTPSTTIACNPIIKLKDKIFDRLSHASEHYTSQSHTQDLTRLPSKEYLWWQQTRKLIAYWVEVTTYQH